MTYSEAANAGADQYICGPLVATLAGNTPTVGTGTWTKQAGPAGVVTFSAANSASSTATVPAYGTYTFRWTITNGPQPVPGCSTYDDVEVTYYQQPTANAGSDAEINAKTYTLAALPFGYLPAPNQNWGTHTWSLRSSSTGGVVTDWGAGAGIHNATIIVDKYGDYVFRWTETNGTCSHYDEVTLKFVEGANAGPDQDLCNVTTTILSANTPSTGTGTWSKISGSGTVSFLDGVNNPGTRISVTQYDSYVLQWTLSVGIPPANQDQVTIDFNEMPTASAGADYEICYAPILNIAGIIGGGASSGTWTMTGGAGTLGASITAAPDVTATYTTDPSDAGKTLTFRLTTDNPAGACPSVWDEVLVKINPLPETSAITGPILLCEGSESKVYSVENTPGSTYTWTVPVGMTITSPAGLYFIIVDADDPTAPGAKITVVEKFTSTTNCVGPIVNLPVTVSPEIPGVTVTGPTAVCKGETGIVYSVPDNAGSSYAWIVPAGASIVSPAGLHQISVNFNIEGSGPVSVIETTSAGCLVSHIPITVVIRPLPVAYNLTAPQAYCSTETGVTVTLADSEADVVYQLHSSLGPVGAAAAGTGSALIWPNIPAGTYHVTGTRTTTDPPRPVTTCQAQMNGTVTIVVNNINAGTIGTAQALCENTAPAPFTSIADATGSGSITYQWQISEAAAGPWSNIIGATSATYTSGPLGTDRYYKRIASSTLGTSVCSAESASILVKVDNFSAGTITPAQTICEASVPAELISGTAPSADGGTLTYQWMSSTDGLTYTNVASGGNAETYTSTSLSMDTWFRRIVTSDLSPALCALSTNSVKVTVVNFTPGVIISDQTICEGTVPATFTGTAASGDGTFTYQWQESTDDITYADIAVSATGLTYTSPALSTEKYFRRKAVSVLNTTCVKYTNPVHVTINNLDPGTISAAQDICENDVPAGLSGTVPVVSGAATFEYAWQSSTDNSTWVNIPAATTKDYAPPALGQDTWYRRNVTSTLNSNTCTETSPAVKITVNNFTPGLIGADQTVCVGGVVAPLTTTTAPSGDSGFALMWQESPNGTAFTDILTATTGTYTPAGVTEDTWYRIKVTSVSGTATCVEYTNAVRITVINFDPGSIADNQVICENTMAANLSSVTPSGDGAFTYKWFVSTNGTDFTVTAATGETFNPGVLTADRWYYREVTAKVNSQSCIDVTNTVHIAVNNFTPGSIKSAQTICEGGNPLVLESDAAVTFDAGAVITYQWKQSDDGIAFTDITVDGTSETYDPPVLTADKWYKRAVTSTMGTNACTEETSAVKVTVINFSKGSIGGDQTICENTKPTSFTAVAASGDGSKAYLWQYSLNNTDWFDAAGTNTNSGYTAPDPLTADTYYRRRVTATEISVSCVEYTNTILVTVNNFDPGTISTSQDICEGGIPSGFTSTIDATGDAGAVIVYQWQSSTNGTDFINIDGSTLNEYSAGALTVDTWYRRQAASTLNGTQCVEYTPAVKVTVNNFTPGLIGADQTVCVGGAVAPLTTTTAPSGDSGFALMWQESPNGTAFTDILTATTGTYTPAGLTEDTWYRIKVTSVSGTATCVEYTNAVRISVNNLDPKSIGSDQTICEGNAPVPLTSVTPTGDGTITYKWYSSPDGTTWSPAIAGANSETYSPGILATDKYYRREVTSTLNGKACTEFTATVKITVNNMTPGSIKNDQTICDGAIPVPIITDAAATFDAGATLTYQWKISTNGVAYTDIIGETLETLTPGALTADTWYKRSAKATMGANECTEESNAVRITVINFSAGSISGEQTICEATAPSAFGTVTPTGDGSFTYQWQSKTSSTAWVNIGPATSESYTSGPLTEDTWFRRIVTSTVNTVPCALNTNEIKVTVNHVDPGTVGADATICEGSAPATFTGTVPTGDGILTYQWQSSLDGSGYTNITGATGPTYTSTPLGADTWFKRQVISTLNGKACGETSPAILVTVVNFNPGTISGAQTVCVTEDPVAFSSVTPTGDGTFTYAWESSPDNSTWSPVALATGETYDPPVLAQDTWFRRIVTSTLSSVPCALRTNSVKITVNNFVPGSIGSDQTICENTAPVPLTSVTPTGDGMFTYQWEQSTDGVNFTSIGGALNETFSPPALTTDTWYRRVVTSTLSSVPCALSTNMVKITVNNFIPGSISGAVTICEGSVPAAFGSVLPSGDGTSYAYQWKSSSDGVNFVNISGATDPTYASTALSTDTWFKRVVTSTLDGRSCVKETNVVKVTVNNVNGGTIISDQTICIGSDPVTFGSIVDGTGDGTITFEWQQSTDGLSYAPIGSTNMMVYDAHVISVNTWYRRITKSLLDGVECTKMSNAVKITVNDVQGGVIGSSQAICYGSAPAMFTSVSDGLGTGTTVTYQWLRSNDDVIYSTIPAATAKTYTAGAHYTDTWYKRRIVSVLNGVMCFTESNSIKVTVNPLPMAVLSGGATICPTQSSTIKVEMLAGASPYTVNIENHGIITGYVSNTPITVTPGATKTYKLLSVKDANDCEILAPHANLSGTATVTVRLAPVIGTSPVDRTICEYGATYFESTTSQGDDITWQWYVDKNTGTFEPLPEGGVFFGTNNSKLNIYGGSSILSGYKFRAVATTCGISVTSGEAVLTVNTSPVIETQPVDKNVCNGENTSFSVTAIGTGITYRWQVKSSGAFTDIPEGGVYSGTNLATLTLTNVPAGFHNNMYRVIVSGTCPAPATSNFVILKVGTSPVVSLNPASKAVCDEAGTVFMTAGGTGLINEMRWQVNNGGTWTDLADGPVYNGTNTTQLTFINPPATLNGKQYRLSLIAECSTVYTNPATLTVNNNPVVSFPVNPISHCGGEELTLTPLVTGGATPDAHTWSGQIAPLNAYNVPAPKFKTLIDDSYELVYKVRDINGCTGTAPVTVNVSSPDASFTHEVQNGCTPLTVQFNITNMTGITSWEWDFGDGSPKNITDANPVHEYVNSEGPTIQYRTVKLTVRKGLCEISKTSVVTVYPMISADISGSKLIVCHGEAITFTALAGGSTYEWNYGDDITSVGANVATHTYSNSTSDTIRRKVIVRTNSFYNCSDTASIFVTILPKPVAAFTATPVRQVYTAAGNAVTIVNETNAGPFTWSWNFGDGVTSTEKTPSHTYNKIGEFEITLEASTSACSAKVKHTVHVDPLPPIASFDSIPYGCEPLEITFNNTSQNVNMPGTSYRWDFGDGGTSVAKNPVYTYFDPGVYRVELTVTGPGGTSASSRVVKVYATPVAAFDIAPTFVFVNDEKVRGFNLSQGADYWVWEWGDGDTSRMKDPSHKYMEEGIYDVSLSAYKDNGNGHVCYDKYVLAPGVTVEPAGDIKFSSVFRPNTNGPVEVSELPTGGDEIDQFFFPPVRDKVLNYKLQIFNRLGVMIFESRDINIPWNGYYKGELCPQGVYVWYVEGKYANGQVYKKVGDITLLH